jgi:uncharacterized protein (DUF2062 family)
MSARAAIRRRFVEPFLKALRQGVTAEKIALTIALGVTLGVTPMVGLATLLCTAAAMMLRLNLPAIQVVNNVVYPLQIMLLVPFLRAGAWIFGERLPAISAHQILGLVRHNVWQAISALGAATMHGLVAWLCFAAIVTGVLYAMLVPVLRWVGLRYNAGDLAAGSFPAYDSQHYKF